ncbi:hypothetical protein B9T24_16445 [Acinetobacter sp. ANC 4654]|uniref:hypothetical protein n=1 Tax=Acinetobacter sp. ANC 4654 TaxID=1977872 RepID=UPI000A34524C|nr:hypothetical protein [Acinetobacter sp. ANC 4654]OTG90255.1 hypothetical protein B9T24_16445 [Acinetobacter sp. ANC 4654]
MKDFYEEWFPLGDDLPLLDYVSMESIYAGKLKFLFKRTKKSTYDAVNLNEKIVVEFELQPISYRVSDESYRQRTLNALPTNRNGSFFISNQSFFLRDFYSDAGEIYQDIECEHLLIVTPNTYFDFILDERPQIYISH